MIFEPALKVSAFFMKNFRAESWKDYELIDCGRGKKLERFGQIILIRPEPNAPFNTKLSPHQWLNEAHAEFVEKGHTTGWRKKLKSFPDQWDIRWNYKHIDVCFNLKLTAFKHVGLFPEQSVNWKLLVDFLSKHPSARVLNLFAYTGAASVVAKACGADVVHVDSVRQVVHWANRNMTRSGLTDIRWVIEDALRFAEREMKRERVYDVVIMDPPAFGLGAKGERWRLEDQLPKLINSTLKLLEPQAHFMLLNTYTPVITTALLEELFRREGVSSKQIECGELHSVSKYGFKLLHGATIRYVKY